MTITYQTTFVGKCPVDGTLDVYELTVATNFMVPVEDILAAIQEATALPAYQEVITSNIAARIDTSWIKTVGVHSGVKTVVTLP